MLNKMSFSVFLFIHGGNEYFYFINLSLLLYVFVIPGDKTCLLKSIFSSNYDKINNNRDDHITEPCIYNHFIHLDVAIPVSIC